MSHCEIVFGLCRVVSHAQIKRAVGWQLRRLGRGFKLLPVRRRARRRSGVVVWEPCRTCFRIWG